MTRRKATRDAAAIAADLMFAPAVMWMRIPTMVAEPRRAGGLGVESMRAIDEKTKAAAQGALSAQASLARAAMSFWPDVMAGKVPSLWSGAAAEDAVNAAWRPAGRAVRANFRRLGKIG